MSDKSSKTEQPTPRRKQKARDEGRFAVSREAFSAFLTVITLAGLFWMQDDVSRFSMQHFRAALVACFRPSMVHADLSPRFFDNPFGILAQLAAVLACVTLFGFIVQLALTGGGFSAKLLMPSAKRFNPVTKLSGLPKQNMAALVQSVLLLPLFIWVLYSSTTSAWENMRQLPRLNLFAALGGAWDLMRGVVWKALFLLILFGCIDFVRQRRKHMGELRMSKQEIRDEHKESEGSPEVKMRMRSIRRALLRRRMMQDVPKATAVVTNPTHYAIAIRYDVDSMATPMVVAKGKDFLALRIRKVATEHQVPIVENPPLARALYDAVQVGQEIPPQFYRAIAEVLAYIYRLTGARMTA